MNRLVLIGLVSGFLFISLGCSAKTTAGPANPLATQSTAEASPSPTVSPQDAVAESGWAEFKAPDGSFNARFPVEPKADTVKKEKYKQTQWVAELKDGTTYAVVLTEIRELSATAPAPAEMFKGLIATLKNSYGPTAKVESQQETTIAGCPGVEFVISFEHKGKPYTVNGRALIAHEGHQLFQLAAGGPASAESEKFFQSFQLGKYAPSDESED